MTETNISNVVQLHNQRTLPGDDNIVVSIELITPQMATNWLRCNRLNRPTRRNHIAFLSREITAGLWQLNGQPIVISENEEVLDGQHRLMAIIDSGVAIRTLVVYGVSKEAFKTIDTGAIRTGADALAVWCPGKPVGLTKTLGSAVPWCVGLERGIIKEKARIANAESIDYVSRHPSMWKIAEVLSGYPKDSRRLLSLSLGTALYEMFARKDHEKASEFMYDIFGDEAKGDAKPSIVLRHMLERDSKRIAKYPATIKARMAIKAWNITRSKNPLASASMIAVSSRDPEGVVIK